MNIRKKHRDDNEYSHANRQAGTQLVVSLFILQQKEEAGTGYVGKPQDVGNDKDRHKGDHIVDTCVDHCVLQPVPVLNQRKADQICDHIAEHGPHCPELAADVIFSFGGHFSHSPGRKTLGYFCHSVHKNNTSQQNNSTVIILSLHIFNNNQK